jgi:hypothetical protein
LGFHKVVEEATARGGIDADVARVLGEWDEGLTGEGADEVGRGSAGDGEKEENPRICCAK